MPALLLEGPAGEEARAVVMVRNDLDREAEAPVVATMFVGPGDETRDLELRADPARVRVAPGSIRLARTLVLPISAA